MSAKSYSGKQSAESQKTATGAFNSIHRSIVEHKYNGVSSTNDNRGTAKFMSVDESDEYENPHEEPTERITNSFNLTAEVHNTTMVPKMVVGFDDED